MPKIPVACKQCGSTFLVYPYRAKEGASLANYCSRTCNGLAKKGTGASEEELKERGRARAKDWAQRNPEKVKARNCSSAKKGWYEKNKAAIQKKNKEVYDPEKEKLLRASRRDYLRSYMRGYNVRYREQNASRLSEYKKDWADKNADRLRENRSAYYLENKDKIKAMVAQYRQTEAGRQVKRNSFHRRRKNLRSKVSDITGLWLIHLRAESPNCAICKCELQDAVGFDNSRQLDHITPLGVGGLHRQDNVRYTCRRCNLTRPKRL